MYDMANRTPQPPPCSYLWLWLEGEPIEVLWLVGEPIEFLLLSD